MPFDPKGLSSSSRKKASFSKFSKPAHGRNPCLLFCCYGQRDTEIVEDVVRAINSSIAAHLVVTLLIIHSKTAWPFNHARSILMIDLKVLLKKFIEHSGQKGTIQCQLGRAKRVII